MNVGVIDIGTNSMRLLVTDGATDAGRWVEVTGLGRDVDRTGLMAEDRVQETLAVLGRYSTTMDDYGVAARRAIATSASRDALNGAEFLARAATVLGFEPELITGSEEAAYAFAGATAGLPSVDGVVVTDIGGGSTEFVTGQWSRSIDIGSVRLTERYLPGRPASREQLALAIEHVADLFESVPLDTFQSHIGVAGTWTSLAALARGLGDHDEREVHGFELHDEALDEVTERLRSMTVEETAALPAIDPKRAPVILAGAVIATMITETLGVAKTVVSESDTLDGVAAEMLDLA